MRYQEPIYIQNQNSAVRNKDILNVNMSSDLGIFEAPSFNIGGASKISCVSGYTGTSYVITTATTIPLVFNFTGNTDSFTANSATFKYEVYKYSKAANVFTQPSLYKSNVFEYPSFSGTNTVTDNINVNTLSLDGEYIVKGYFTFNPVTEYLNKLGKKVDTSVYISGTQYGLYNDDLDFYFIAFKGADIPKLLQNGSNTPPPNQLFQQTIIPNDGDTVVVINQIYSGFFVLTLNGLVLAPTYDFTFTGNVITLNQAAVSGDIITVTYTTTGGNNLLGDNIYVQKAITSGITNGEGSNDVYYNTTEQKYEIYTKITPLYGGTILVMINGITLANGIDYYQSSTNLRRIILEGDILIGDIITIVYFGVTSVVNGIVTNTPSVSWSIDNPPQLVNGSFTLEVSTATTFTTTYFTNQQPYIVGKTTYYDSFTASGSVGTSLYYRVVNEKQYETLCGDIITDIAYSEVIPLVIQTNAINKY